MVEDAPMPGMFDDDLMPGTYDYRIEMLQREINMLKHQIAVLARRCPGQERK